ncbi:ankyrin repeat protein [Cordyceps fumosorosea ARSEF 2679]|uniref:Ankyrin repeat protein n=1 Tax=Cordyceps fumosorosea (strain ARSEF 2679) TaxID=1081104 RepID=A0A168CLM6_CORFA|nr:ankyrin repeat protein [Cordyceps fumosorosea ARSEF 2679]OAA71530.1 ankyrin repeat protein [Cordyceps fumosorosea ARSEF 2679]
MTGTALPPLNAAWDPRLETPDADEFCWTPLQLAARSGDLALMRRILDADPAAAHAPPRGYYGQTALQAACVQGDLAAVRLLLAAGADVHAGGGHNMQRNALQLACGQGDEAVVDALLAAGARVDEPAVTRYNGRTALQAACERGHAGRADIIEMLLAAGAEVNARSARRGRAQSALQSAVAAGHEEAARVLRENGATGKSGGRCFLFP